MKAPPQGRANAAAADSRMKIYTLLNHPTRPPLTHPPHHDRLSRHPKQPTQPAPSSSPPTPSSWLHTISSDIFAASIFADAYMSVNTRTPQPRNHILTGRLRSREETPTPSRTPPEDQASARTSMASILHIPTSSSQAAATTTTTTTTSRRPLNSDLTLTSSPPPAPAPAKTPRPEPTQPANASSNALARAYAAPSTAEPETHESRKPRTRARKRRSSMLHGIDAENIIVSQRRTRARKLAFSAG
ncbi:uncharacterized protein K452DRAFT_310141 [Aplosporella prunicola CBS 121167]|uniref:Uncharacterized protein n=1 Tax=Aplosporella prunicola CBS 121167 TaxID=1176127 RepID=A0A6A6B8H3_9PEZI|nr:uncharacterized protein K452DRAFT_310141 [Aplosporella prunicola CBS 121167]KAF2140400.1 hypothetical protein K452DRAFT_310141 [Aplosporella prunicola CBS 121167]